MTTDSALIEKIKTILNLEVAAKQIYEEHLEEFTNERVKSKLEKIRNDEIKHIDLTTRILNIVQK